MQTLPPGETVPDSGIYEARTPDGQAHGRATLVKGKTAPPVPVEGAVWHQVADTNPYDRSSRSED